MNKDILTSTFNRELGQIIHCFPTFQRLSKTKWNSSTICEKTVVEEVMKTLTSQTNSASSDF